MRLLLLVCTVRNPCHLDSLANQGLGHAATHSNRVRYKSQSPMATRHKHFRATLIALLAFGSVSPQLTLWVRTMESMTTTCW